MSAAPAKQIYTKEEYFALLAESTEKLEYHDGEIVAMAGGTANHSTISYNAGLSLGIIGREKGCFVSTSDLAIAIPTFNRYMFPDFAVTCGEMQFEDKGKRRLSNPNLIIEVFSESTEGYDRGDKFSYYRSLPSFKEYILISSTKVKVEGYYREDKSLWRLSSAEKLEDSITIYSLGIELKVADLYLKTEGVVIGH